jgi:hypothetical protein
VLPSAATYCRTPRLSRLSALRLGRRRRRLAGLVARHVRQRRLARGRQLIRKLQLLLFQLRLLLSHAGIVRKARNRAARRRQPAAPIQQRHALGSFRQWRRPGRIRVARKSCRALHLFHRDRVLCQPVHLGHRGLQHRRGDAEFGEKVVRKDVRGARQFVRRRP